MVAGYWTCRHTCTATTCPSCGYEFCVDVTASTTYRYTTSPYGGCNDFSRFYDEVEALPTKIELARMRAASIQQMAKRRAERTPRASESMNAGMHIRQMRRSAGLARART